MPLCAKTNTVHNMVRCTAFANNAVPVALVPEAFGMLLELGGSLSFPGVERTPSNLSIAGMNGLFGLTDLQLVVILSK